MTVRRLEPYAVTIFAEMSALAARIGAVNLGQGFPDEDGPPAMLKAAENAIAEGVNQYPPGLGIAPLREAIAAQRKRHFGTDYDPDTDLLVTADEVYEHLVFDGRRHIPLANYPGMADRTVTISSAAKMFNCTGWKIGWACGAPELISGVRAAKQYLSYVGGAPFQPAVAHALNTEEAWVAALRESLQAKRDKLGSAP